MGSIDIAAAAQAIQKGEPSARAILERLVETGLVASQGIKKGRTYILSASTYRQLGQSADYIRQVGFDRIQQEQMVLQYVQEHEQITRRDVVTLCRLSKDQARRLLRKLTKEEKLISHGQTRSTYYTASPLNKMK